MSIDVFRIPLARPSKLKALLDWLRHARIALRQSDDPAAYLSDRHLADIGAERPPRGAEEEVGRLSLLDIGWQQPRRPGRR